MTTKKRPEKIETLERGITILRNVFDFDIPKLFDNSIQFDPISEKESLQAV